MTAEVENLGEVHRNLPIPFVDNITAPLRVGRYGDQRTENLIPTKHVLADEGSYYVATNPTPGTGVAYGSGGTQTSFSDTVPFLIFQNTDTQTNSTNKRLYLDYIKIIQFSGTAPASTTSVQLAAKIDSALRTNTAGSMTTITPVGANMDMPSSPIGRVLCPAGAVATIPAASNAARIVGREQIKGGPTLLLDQYNLSFGCVDVATGGGYLTTVAAYNSRMSPVILGPQMSLVIHLWLPAGATNPFTFEFECGWWER